VRSNIFNRRTKVARLEIEQLDSFATMLQARRYSATTIIQYLSRSRCFCRWMIKNNVPFDQADDQVIGRYLKSLGTPGVRKKAKGACRTLLRHLHEINAIKLISVDHNPDEAEQWLIRYREYLERVHGLAKGTRAQYVFFATRFLNGKCKDHLVDWSLVTADTIVQYVLLEVAHRKGFGPQHVATAIRSFLRFLASNSLAPAGLDAAIPTIRRWSQASLPQHLSQQELDRLIASSSADDTEVGIRNHAILLLLCRLGLRAHEVVRLRLGDIDWRRAFLLIRSSKTHSERTLPLTQEVGRALLSYLERGRPTTISRELFLRCKAPLRPLTASSITGIVKVLLANAEIGRRSSGAHLLRHTLATHMVNHGASFKEVADVLGHLSLESTAIYAKLDLEALSQIALPWIGGDQ